MAAQLIRRDAGLLIGFVGPKGAGKDTAAFSLIHCQGFEKIAFAQPLVKAVRALFALPEALCNGWAKEDPGPLGVSYRRGMQVLGTDFVRDQLKTLLPESVAKEGEFFLEHFRLAVYDARRAGRPVASTDVRFLNEAELILELGGRLIFIERSQAELDRFYHLMKWKIDDQHPGVTGAAQIRKKFADDPRMTVITNDGTQADLAERVKAAIRSWDP
jgi:hypothetical protein